MASNKIKNKYKADTFNKAESNEQKTKAASFAGSQWLVIAPLLFLLLFAVYWSFRYSILPIQDLPNHLANVFILLNYDSSGLFQQYFTLKFNLFPYLLQDLLLSIFMAVGGVDFAGNLFVAISMISVPLSLFYLLKVIRPDKLYLCYFSLPFAWNDLLLKGNMNYILGLSLSFICLAFLWKIFVHKTRLSKKQWAAFSIFGILLYLTHLVAFVLVLFILLVIVLYDLIARKKYTVAVPIIAVGVLFSFNFMFISTGRNGDDASFLSNTAQSIIDIGNIFTFSQPGDNNFLIPIFVLMGLMMAVGFTRIKEEPLPFVICGTLLLAYLFVPPNLPPLVRPQQRILYLLLFILPLCCIGRKHIAIEKAAVMVLCAVIFLQAYVFYAEMEDYSFPELIRGRNILRAMPKEKKLMYVCLDDIGARHLSSYYVIDGNGYVPTLFSAPYMIVQYKKKPSFNPASDKINHKTMEMFDYLLVRGEDRFFDDFIKKYGFNAAYESGSYRLYENSLPSRDIQ